MNDPRTKLEKVISATLTKRGDILEGAINSTGKARDAKPKRVDRSQWDDALAEHVATMTDGDSVDVEVTINLAENGKRTARLVGVASLAKVEPDPGRGAALQAGGFVNPYTFVPTLPRSDENGTRLAGTGLEDAPPPSHAYHTTGQWSGTLALTLTTVTPLLLPVPAAEQPKDGPRTFDVRVGPDGRPFIHGASFKGALRSAYETITASRYGVFVEHHDRLAYRVPANTALDLTPARVHREGDTAYFRLCRGDADWARHCQSSNQAQYAALVPAYGSRRVQRLGDLAAEPLSRHHGTQVYARVVLPRREGSGRGRSRTWQATHLARTEEELLKNQRAPVNRADTSGPPGSDGPHRIVRGWLSATGRSIASKHNERLFVETPGLDIPLTAEHERYWQSVLRAYDLAQGYHDPKATYRRDPMLANGIERSWHVPSTPLLRTLPHDTLVYVKYDDKSGEISQVHPVMIGRLPFAAAPDESLHESLRPADDRDRLSPADRLFGWVPPGRRDDGTETNDGASGYRGRLRIRSITCTTDDWRPPTFPPDGVTLAPLSSPKPTQFRFYATPDPSTGMPVRRGIAKADGYPGDGGLRGRKMYRWREEDVDHWQPTRGKDDPARGYLALKDHDEHSTQLARHRGWVRPEVTFRVDLFLDGVPEPELGALLWLLTLDATAAPLRLGAGKPYGFGVVAARLDADRTRLWDATGIRDGWLRLTRPDPVDPAKLTKLAATFAATARGNAVLREATESYLAAAKPVTDPVHYPRKTPEPQAESYQWFVANDRIERGRVAEGWPLPHVRDGEQRLPYLGGESDAADRTGRSAASSRRTQMPRPVPRQGRRSGSGQATSPGYGRSSSRPGSDRGGEPGHRSS
ncbi:TIGR03986 family CRISPR-associated RAMP protein [Plantactinospora sp. S1510]|uniref:TIGR03986 family CRISPR-associated RAMP protein n=1 Tax=Plantactinospora alkalitolerans TaxID=2789879 RepID=A0ABS0GSH7_9ACTN|nr:TIGR03986 family CRISPR-associated RAMP protein [Plantactinospora alkalitolerans]MBF9129146.1 TIGR03986 family CRISPR-associated RAMP protein [Plantactinospora alkalitolerans]